MSPKRDGITVSVVSHGHGPMVETLVRRLLALPEVDRVIVTLNRPEPFDVPPSERLTIVRNREPKGFAANNNAAFAHCRSEFFCLINPDVECAENPFPPLIAALVDPQAGVAGPLVRDGDGRTELSARRFPTIASLCAKAMGRIRADYPSVPGRPAAGVDWIAGMFMLFRSTDYRAVGMLDEGYHLYYEDVDICRRLRDAGRRVLYCTGTAICHRAQRHSRRYWTYRAWHLCGMARYFAKAIGSGRPVQARVHDHAPLAAGLPAGQAVS